MITQKTRTASSLLRHEAVMRNSCRKNMILFSLAKLVRIGHMQIDTTDSYIPKMPISTILMCLQQHQTVSVDLSSFYVRLYLYL